MRDSFLDSNVLLYFASGDVSKADRAEAMMKSGGVISVQVLNEVAAVCRRKFSLSWAEVMEILAVIRHALHVEPLLVEVHDKGVEIARRYRLSIYDSMLAASALLAGCQTLWSEDMHDGLVIEGALTIRNPFA